MKSTPVILRNVASWQAEKRDALLRQSNHAEDPVIYGKLMREAGRRARVAQDCTRQAWLQEHKKERR